MERFPVNTIEDGEYMIWGDNAEDVQTQKTEDYLGMKIMNRKWLINTNMGDVPSITDTMKWNISSNLTVEKEKHKFTAKKAASAVETPGIITSTEPLPGYEGHISFTLSEPLGSTIIKFGASIATAEMVSEQLGKAELTFVGHSKGGAEAAGNALATNRNALLYNPAAISASAYGLNSKSYTGADANGMTAFIVKGDMVDSFINQFFAKPIDKVVYLPRQSKNPVTNHLIDTMIQALQKYQETNKTED